VVRIGGVAAGCGGVALFEDFAEVKRMYISPRFRGQGGAESLLVRIEAETVLAGLGLLRLETGRAQPAAVRIYERCGFTRCGAFGAYLAMAPHRVAHSLFYEKHLSPETFSAS
jgi:putative acetyltransferase